MTEEIEKRIKMMGLRKDFLAKKIGVSQSMFSHFLAGRRNLSDAKIADLKKYLGIS